MSEQTPTHEQIKRAVDESLLEALKTANELSESKNSGYRFVLSILSQLMPLALLALIGWVLLNSIELQRDVMQLRLQVTQIEKALDEHNYSTDNRIAANAAVHHLEPQRPCNACHVQFYYPENAKKARKLKILPSEVQKQAIEQFHVDRNLKLDKTPDIVEKGEKSK